MAENRRMGAAAGVVLALTLALGLVGAGPAAAKDRRVRIVNGSKHAIAELTATHSGNRPSEENLIADGLPPGGATILDLDDGSNYCRFDLRARFEDGVELEKARVNVCEVGTFRYTE